jgi:hypothetical protein
MRDETAHEWGTQNEVSLWVGHPPGLEGLGWVLDVQAYRDC